MRKQAAQPSRQPEAGLAADARIADKPRMSRRLDERTTLRPLVADLARDFARHEASWKALANPRLLRDFRRDLDDIGELLESRLDEELRFDRIRSVCAELVVARRLLEHGCTIEHEVDTPSGRHVDFRARRDGATLCIHVKRAPLPTLRDVEMSVPRAWRRLETVGRGLVVALSLERNLRGKAIESALAEAFPFLEAARVGEELSFHGASGEQSARLRVVAPSTGGRVEIVADLSAAFDDHVPRFQATLRKAFSQFMPRSENLVVVCGSSGGIDPFAIALLGSHIERWDKRPRVGELVAYGRGTDGFWAGSLRNQSRLAAYWPLARDAGPLLFLRETAALRANPPRSVLLARSVFA